MFNKQVLGLIIAFFAALGLIGVLASVALPHAGEMIYQEKAHEKETELLQIRSAVSEMLQLSPSGKLESVGPVVDLTLVHTADSQPLVLTDYLPAEMDKRIVSGCTYSFTADGYVIQLTN